MKRRGRAAFASLACLPLLLSACNSNVNGNPTPVGTSAGASATASPSSKGSNPFAGMNPCTVLDQALTGQDYPAAKPTTADSKRGCETSKPGLGGVTLLLQDGQTIDENIVDPSKTKTGHVHDRRAIQERDLVGAGGGCAIRMEVKPSSRALVVGSLSTVTSEQACGYAGDIALKVEPLLPKAG